jgi:hypothetical protein
MKTLLKFPLEALIWFFGLITLALISPDAGHFTICPLSNLGFDFCPGCGLGHSISLLFRGEFAKSFAAHPLGIFAVIILTYRIIHLTKNYLKLYGTSN